MISYNAKMNSILFIKLAIRVVFLEKEVKANKLQDCQFRGVIGLD